ncbi:uncharacterized protein TRUGW13939_09166 [Talaromyces rugulosus]|uniref:NACHT domain-containing protein n=1 Tax=Talaromyces rugulosus TaxID=121627 RepID=A0A7H8R6M9_TALRU|nr:uncharacterized protein TRUGW13939_09166 [Talaromyces rugulosus]QKX62010.1 hypothetical protein TRUGW13939_09166 [Talaromyces rugulosus]
MHLKRLFKKSPGRNDTKAPPAAAASPTLPTGNGELQLPTKPHTTETTSTLTGPSTIPRDLWREALETLPKQIQQELNTEGTEQKPLGIQISELLEVTRKRQEECERKFWKFRVGDHEIVLRDYAVKTVGCLQQIGDIAVMFAPPQASIPWSVIKMVMQTAVVESAQMCALLASVEKIVRIVNRGQVYELVYTSENTPKLAFENLQSVLVELYGACMELLANSSKLFTKNTAERTVRSILHPGDTADIFSKLVQLETKLSHEVQVCESGRSAATDADYNLIIRNIIISCFLTRLDERVCTLLEKVNEKEQLEILEWISPIPYKKHHDTVKEARTSDTCEWLLQNKRFREWEDTSSSVILWLQGSPGAGKTFLTSKVIDHVQSRLELSPNHEAFAFFYCNRNESERRDPLYALQSYVRQLSTTARNSGDIRSELRALRHEVRSKGGSDLSFNTCKEQLLESVNLYPKTTLVLDALDECEPDSRSRLIDTIEFLLSESKRPLKIFISSRPDGDIRARFLSRPNIEIQATDNQNDIEKFVNAEMVKHPLWEKISLSLQEEIIQTLLKRSNGMFQWAYLQTKQLLKLKTRQDLKVRLGKLPIDLKDTYDEIYCKIAESEHGKDIADRAFMWRKVWRFSHLSVTEYFEKHHWGVHQAHGHIAKVCLKFLIQTYNEIDSGSKIDSLDNEDTSEQEDEIPDLGSLEIFDLRHPFQMYIGHHWIVHVQTQEGKGADPILTRLLKDFLGSPNESSLQYRAWYRQIASDKWPEPSTSAFYHINEEEISPESAAILSMCRFSLYTPLLDWWDNAEIVFGTIEIVNFLIEKGADVNMPLQSGKYGSALVVAAYGEKLEIIEFLLQKGADINMQVQTGYYSSALAAAAWSGKTEIVSFLVEKGADVNTILQDGEHGSALAAATYMGELETVVFLVQKGADVNMSLQVGDYGNALIAAVEGGVFEVTKYLLAAGANANQHTLIGRYSTPLVAAAYLGRKKCVEALIEAGAEVNVKLESGSFRTCLQASQSDVSPEDRERVSWDKRSEEDLEQEKGEVTELLQRYGATEI